MKSISLNLPGSTWSWREERKSKMTCLLLTNNNNYSILCSDTWNTTYLENKYTQKITYNINNKIIIGSAGNNVTRYEDGTRIKILDIMQDFCDSYNGNNINEALHILFKRTKKFVDDIVITNVEEIASVQYLIVYFDKTDSHVKYLKLGYDKYLEIDWNKTKTIKANSYQHNNENTNFSCTSFGRYHTIFNLNHVKDDYDALSKDELLQLSINYVQEQIDYEKDFPIEQRGVGGDIHWCCMDKEGNIETNIT